MPPVNTQTQVPFPLFQVPFPPFRAEANMANAQEGLANWSRAWTQIAEGLNLAGLAHLELARTMTATLPSDLARSAQMGSPNEAAREWLVSAQERYDTAVRGYRRINDDLAANFFRATEAMVDAMAPRAKEAGPKTTQFEAARPTAPIPASPKQS